MNYSESSDWLGSDRKKVRGAWCWVAIHSQRASKVLDRIAFSPDVRSVGNRDGMGF